MYKEKAYPPAPPLVKELLVETNGERIRSMSDEKLAEALYNIVEKLQTEAVYDLSRLYCDGKNCCIDADGNIACYPNMEKACILRWLRQPAKEAANV